MASAKAWGTITIVDTTDIGQFSVTPSSNRATTVIYTPDNNTYTPNWAETSGNVTITPIIYYGGTQLSPGDNPTVTWAYKTNDSTTFTTITSSSTSSSPSWAKPQSNGTLKLTGNPFTSSSVSSVTFKCTANYNEPATNLPLTAAGEITYSVVRQAASVPYVRITGENVFKYNTSQTLVGAESITLTANHAHCTIERWEYMDVNGWTAIANTTGVETLTINAKSTAHDVYFKNDIATFRVVTSVDGLIDVHVITKIHDGAPGQSTLAAILTNEDQMLPADAAGHVTKNTGYVDAYTQLIIYRGGEDVTSEYKDITISASEGITFEKSSDGTNWQASTVTTGVFTHVHVTGIGDTYNVGSVTFSAKKTSGSTEAPLVKKFSLVKVSTGADGADAVSYMMDLSRNIVHVTENGTLKGGDITLKLYSRRGSAARALYSGRIKAYEGNSTSAFYTHTSSNANTFTLTNSGTNTGTTIGTIIPRVISAGSVRIEMFAAGGTTTLLDTQTIVLVKDGATGPQGPDGAPGTSPINVVLGNYSDSIACNKSNVILPTNTALVLDIPYTAYHGTNRVYCVVQNAPSITYASNKDPIVGVATASDASTDGHIRFTFPKGAAIDDAHANGTVAITFVVKETAQSTKSLGTVLAYYTYSRVSTGATGATGAKGADGKDGKDGVDGESAYVGIISTPNGNVFSNGAGSLLLTAQLYLGSDDVSSASSFQWAKFSGSAYTDLSGKTSSILSVDGDTVDGLASYRCTISHNSAVRAVLYATLIDKTDPIQAEILSTAGDKFVNGVAEGAMYVKVYRNGVEIDPLPTEVISKTAPTNPKAGAMYFKIDTATNSVKLMKYVSGAWAEQTYTPTASYTWSYLDKDGKETHPSGMATSGKIVYVDGDFVNVKLTAFCKVEV